MGTNVVWIVIIIVVIAVIVKVIPRAGAGVSWWSSFKDPIWKFLVSDWKKPSIARRTFLGLVFLCAAVWLADPEDVRAMPPSTKLRAVLFLFSLLFCSILVNAALGKNETKDH
ncbi:MAG: hypothetical protein PHV93_01730 [Candidatus Pacebacteria bacterium]|nr:hypothetical protein [Candidatus Paceibacterota bacterium]